MDAARYIDPRGGEKIVRIPGAPLKGDHVHYCESSHKGRLLCLDCDAHVRLRIAGEAVPGGSLKSPAAYFAVVAGQRHDTACEFYDAPQKTRPGMDADQGYRVHIDMQEYGMDFTAKDSLPSRRGGPAETDAHDLEGREIYTVKSAADLVEFMTMAETNRVARSVVVFGNGKPVPWREFFVRYSHHDERKQKRFVDLLARLCAGGAGAQIPVLMEMQIPYAKTVYPSGNNLSILSRKIPCERGADGKRHDIVPAVLFDREAAMHDANLTRAFRYGARHLVLGFATLDRPGDGHSYINVIVGDADQVTTVNIENVMKRASAKAHIGQLPSSQLSPK
jgi:hypothetical protein